MDPVPAGFFLPEISIVTSPAESSMREARLGAFSGSPDPQLIKKTETITIPEIFFIFIFSSGNYLQGRTN
jgi:hypothetical protein